MAFLGRRVGEGRAGENDEHCCVRVHDPPPEPECLVARASMGAKAGLRQSLFGARGCRFWDIRRREWQNKLAAGARTPHLRGALKQDQDTIKHAALFALVVSMALASEGEAQRVGGWLGIGGGKG